MPAKEKIGTIVSAKMTNTCIVAVSNRITHKRYGKVLTKTKRYPVHNPKFDLNVGDKVRIRETRPISKTVNWILIDLVKKYST